MKPPRISGTVSRIDPKRTFGFVRTEDGSDDIFFSLADVPGDISNLHVGSVLKGRIVQAAKGPRLAEIEAVAIQATNPFKFYCAMGVALVFGFAILLWQHFEVSLGVSAFLGINVTALFLMGLDKSIARSGSVRTPEIVLFILALMGGCPGILLGIHVFKHKTRKASFQFVLLLIVAAQLFVARLLGVDVGSFMNPPLANRPS